VAGSGGGACAFSAPAPAAAPFVSVEPVDDVLRALERGARALGGCRPLVRRADPDPEAVGALRPAGAPRLRRDEGGGMRSGRPCGCWCGTGAASSLAGGCGGAEGAGGDGACTLVGMAGVTIGAAVVGATDATASVVGSGTCGAAGAGGGMPKPPLGLRPNPPVNRRLDGAGATGGSGSATAAGAAAAAAAANLARLPSDGGSGPRTRRSVKLAASSLSASR
jgi:hypothetical protein